MMLLLVQYGDKIKFHTGRDPAPNGTPLTRAYKWSRTINSHGKLHPSIMFYCCVFILTGIRGLFNLIKLQLPYANTVLTVKMGQLYFDVIKILCHVTLRYVTRNTVTRYNA